MRVVSLLINPFYSRVIVFGLVDCHSIDKLIYIYTSHNNIPDVSMQVFQLGIKDSISLKGSCIVVLIRDHR